MSFVLTQLNLIIAINFLKLDDFRLEIQRRDQEIMSMAAKMKTLEEQHQVYCHAFFNRLIIMYCFYFISI